MTPQEKERIDYEIKAKIDARNKDIAEWGCAFWIAIIAFLILLIIFNL